MVPWPAAVPAQLSGAMVLVIRLMRCCGTALVGPALLTCRPPMPAGLVGLAPAPPCEAKPEPFWPVPFSIELTGVPPGRPPVLGAAAPPLRGEFGLEMEFCRFIAWLY